MITPADSAAAPAEYNAVPVSGFDIQAPQDDLTEAMNAAGAITGAGVVYPKGPRQTETVALLNSAQGVGDFDIMSGYTGTWGSMPEPDVAGP